MKHWTQTDFQNWLYGLRDEDQHLDQQQAPDFVQLLECRRPRQHEHGLDIEHDEQHGHEIEFDREPLSGIAQNRHAGLIRSDLARGAAVGGK